MVLHINVLLYGTKQAAYCFFKTFAKEVKNMMYKQSKADLCLYFAWIDGNMIMLVMWVDDIIVLRPPLLVEKVQQDLEKAFTCKGEMEMTKYVRSKITITPNSTGLGTVKFMQQYKCANSWRSTSHKWGLNLRHLPS